MEYHTQRERSDLFVNIQESISINIHRIISKGFLHIENKDCTQSILKVFKSVSRTVLISPLLVFSPNHASFALIEDPTNERINRSRQLKTFLLQEFPFSYLVQVVLVEEQNFLKFHQSFLWYSIIANWQTSILRTSMRKTRESKQAWSFHL